MEVEDTLEFVITIKRNGKLCLSFHINDYFYRRKEVKASGVAYFVCTDLILTSWLTNMVWKYHQREEQGLRH